MTAGPLSFSLQGIPATFGNAHTVAGGNVTHTITGPTDRRCYVVQGIDVYVIGATAVSARGWYELDGGGQLFFWGSDIDPLVVHPYCGSWRGAIGLNAGATLQIGAECPGIGGLGVAAWGIIVPIEFGGSF